MKKVNELISAVYTGLLAGGIAYLDTKPILGIIMIVTGVGVLLVRPYIVA